MSKSFTNPGDTDFEDDFDDELDEFDEIED